MIDIAKLKIGEKVHYVPEHYKAEGKYENGMIKEVPDFATDQKAVVGRNSIRVVYNCCGDWDRFKEYTSALTNLNDLRLGWRHD